MDGHDAEKLTLLSEIMEVERTVDVIQEETDKKFRVEVVKHLKGTISAHYAVQYYLQKDGLWVKYLNFPWIRQETAEHALMEALNYINDRPQRGDGESS